MDARPVHETDPRLLRRVRIDVSVEESKELIQRLRMLQWFSAKVMNGRMCIHCWEAPACLANENQACQQRLLDHANCEGARYRYHIFVILNLLGLLATAAPTTLA